MIEVGVASPMAHGQATIRTDTPATTANAGLTNSQIAAVSNANPITTGTNTPVTRSTIAWMGSFVACASSTMAMIRDSTLSVPTAPARSARAPAPLTVPPVTEAPTSFRTGSGSPVTMLSSIQD